MIRRVLCSTQNTRGGIEWNEGRLICASCRLKLAEDCQRDGKPA